MIHLNIHFNLQIVFGLIFSVGILFIDQQSAVQSDAKWNEKWKINWECLGQKVFLISSFKFVIVTWVGSMSTKKSTVHGGLQITVNKYFKLYKNEALPCGSICAKIELYQGKRQTAHYLTFNRWMVVFSWDPHHQSSEKQYYLINIFPPELAQGISLISV